MRGICGIYGLERDIPVQKETLSRMVGTIKQSAASDKANPVN